MSLGDLPIELIYEIARKSISTYKSMFLIKNKKIHRSLTTEYLLKKDIFIDTRFVFKKQMFLNVRHTFDIPDDSFGKSKEWYSFGEKYKVEYICYNKKYIKYLKKDILHRSNGPAEIIYDYDEGLITYYYYHYGRKCGVSFEKIPNYRL